MGESEMNDMLRQIRDVAATPQKLYIRTIRKVLRSGLLSPAYPFEGDADSDEVFARARVRMEELLRTPVEHINEETTAQIFREIPGLLPRLNLYGKKGDYHE